MKNTCVDRHSFSFPGSLHAMDNQTPWETQEVAVEPVYNTEVQAFICPIGADILKKYCFDQKTKTLRQCGYICVKPR